MTAWMLLSPALAEQIAVTFDPPEPGLGDEVTLVVTVTNDGETTWTVPEDLLTSMRVVSESTHLFWARYSRIDSPPATGPLREVLPGESMWARIPLESCQGGCPAGAHRVLLTATEMVQDHKVIRLHEERFFYVDPRLTDVPGTVRATVDAVHLDDELTVAVVLENTSDKPLWIPRVYNTHCDASALVKREPVRFSPESTLRRPTTNLLEADLQELAPGGRHTVDVSCGQPPPGSKQVAVAVTLMPSGKPFPAQPDSLRRVQSDALTTPLFLTTVRDLK